MNCNGKLIDVTLPIVMGVLNVTPNSFFDGGQFDTEDTILRQVAKMIDEGADFIDIGGYSSKPNAETVTKNEEIGRVMPVIALILKTYPDTIISVDTFRSEVARLAIESGALIINDISAGNLDVKIM